MQEPPGVMVNAVSTSVSSTLQSSTPKSRASTRNRVGTPTNLRYPPVILPLELAGSPNLSVHLLELKFDLMLTGDIFGANSAKYIQSLLQLVCAGLGLVPESLAVKLKVVCKDMQGEFASLSQMKEALNTSCQYTKMEPLTLALVSAWSWRSGHYGRNLIHCYVPIRTLPPVQSVAYPP